MEPRIQYAKTSDGVSIAFWTLGEGPALVQTPDMPISVALQWQVPELRAWYERLAQNHTVITYDTRGVGLSERNLLEQRPDFGLHDLESVVDAAAIERFSLLATFRHAPYAVAYAARHPERVSRLILYSPVASIREVNSGTLMSTQLRMLDGDFEAYLNTSLRVTAGLPPGQGLRQLVSLYLQSVTRENYRRLVDAGASFDASDLLRAIQSPALVLHRIGTEAVTVDMVRKVSSAIPGARLSMFEGEILFPWFGDAEAVLTAIDEFLGEGQQVAPAAAPSGTAVILFADIVDSTGLTERLGDDAFRDKARGLDAAMRAAIRANGGTPVEGKTLGDGVLAVFTSAKQAIACAQACHAAAGAAGLSLHAGIHAGDVIRESDNVYGGAVNIAARVAAASAAGETLVSGTVRDLARTSAGVSFEDRGEHSLKGVGELVRVWTVREGDG
jgi:class 3 adenylate cyclase/pimeloyl-ACP methyl ester carboxylesterase